MEFIVNHDVFAKAVYEVSRMVPTKSHHAALSGIMIKAEAEGLEIIGCNSELMVKKKIPIQEGNSSVLQVLRNGKSVLFSKYVSEVVKKLPEDIHFTLKDNHSITIQSGEVIFNMNAYEEIEFPQFEASDSNFSIKMNGKSLLEMFVQTAFAAAKTNSRPVLSGVLMELNESVLTVGATNSNRLAVRKMPFDKVGQRSAIIPVSAVNEFIKLMGTDSEDVLIHFSDRQIVFQNQYISLTTRLIEGKYPEIRGLIPSGAIMEITMDRERLRQGVDRAAVLANESKNHTISLSVKEGSLLKITSHSNEIGKIEESQQILSHKGEIGISVSVDSQYLSDALKAIKEDHVMISFGGVMKPILIRPTDTENQMHIISPVRVK
ncbi:DNA polymerase III subunit beta [Falsibacillus pallidus]|uniref:Beta sliding clamp n=1 Tax=Falsibacillus pallidus TaxID=493781 RepID=A0A370GPG5_9BACI|nr:DNA polymerase III subunit beta [Falsibacillus pallidus]RDI45628.1 DNA polymerase III beta subunit family protein [Falsibacillus pallidus]